jgi:hypothetical protein
MTQTPEERQRRKNVAKMERYYGDPEYRASHNARTSAREKMRRAAEPGYKETAAAKMRAKRHDPLIGPILKERANHLQRERYASDPEYKARRSASNALTKKRKREKTPLEKHIEERLLDEVKRRGGMCVKFIDPGRRGAPDRIIMLPGHPSYFAELKRPRAFGELKSWQSRYHDDIRDAGQKVWVLWGDADVDAFLLELDLCL